MNAERNFCKHISNFKKNHKIHWRPLVQFAAPYFPNLLPIKLNGESMVIFTRFMSDYIYHFSDSHSFNHVKSSFF